MTLTSTQSASLTLWYVVNTSLSAYYKVIEHFGGANQALQAPISDWQNLGIHKSHIARLIDDSSTKAFLREIEKSVAAGLYCVLFVEDDCYPTLLKQLYDPPPVLFYRGNVARLNAPQIAMVGSRNPSDYAIKMTFDIAQYLVQCGYAITSGLAQGVDVNAHLGALKQDDPKFFGQTVGVMGTGIDICYPKNHRGLLDEIITMGGCLVTELLPNTPASKHTFPRRNRLVAGLSLATIVTEAALQSGSLITARLANEQGKQVFVLPHRIDNLNAEGCHHLIREGATLIYHPLQVIEDIQNQSVVLPKSFRQTHSLFVQTSQPTSTPKSPSTSSNEVANIPSHLVALYANLSQNYQDVDNLVMQTQLTTADVLSGLIELELLGLVNQVGGRYAKS